MFSKCTILLVVVLAGAIPALAQNTQTDSARVLDEVTVQAYAAGRPVNDVPAPVVFINAKNLERFNNTSILPAVNMIPGVRMEERSPGSYRFSIRGSLLRSPFGVRNIKMYWNGLPLTDGGGNTYINLLDLNAISNLEIIKGPGASLYGANTGGVVLLNSVYQQNQIQQSVVAGGYGLLRYATSLQVGSENVKARIQYARQKSDGYRDHTAMSRDALNADVTMNLGKGQSLSATVVYTDLFYETPGGLTMAQFDADPRQARKGADSLRAAIYNKTFYGGLMYEVQLNKWTVKAGLYGSKSDFVNPTFLNYEIRDERNLGGRATAQYAFEHTNWKGKLTFGAEHQYFRSPIVDYSTNKGFAGSKVLSSDKIYSRQNLFFLQGDFDLPYNFIVTAGASGTLLQYEMLHYEDSDNGAYATPPDQTRNFDPVFSPRVALLKKITPTHSAYASVSYGFSPPSVAEVRPSTNTYNNALNPEHGTNYEIGFKGQIPNGSIRYDVSVYEFDLKETIVIQRTPDNADFFINAGSTQQRGAEMSVTWAPNLSTTGIVTAFALQGNYTANHFYFEKYVNNEVDYSGNRLTGVAPNVAAFGMDVQLVNKLYANITANYVDKIPLNDGNSVYASEYYLFGARIGYKTPQPAAYPVEVFAGVDNLFDRKYSLGNDLNAAGGRFFNAAAGRNFYVGLKINALFSK